MPSMFDDYEAARKRHRGRKARLIAKGLDPRSQKFLKLLYWRGS